MSLQSIVTWFSKGFRSSSTQQVSTAGSGGNWGLEVTQRKLEEEQRKYEQKQHTYKVTTCLNMNAFPHAVMDSFIDDLDDALGAAKDSLEKGLTVTIERMEQQDEEEYPTREHTRNIRG